MDFIESTAAFSPCQLYRYELTRVWERDKPRAVFLLLNPSTATAEKLDPTVTRCVGFARRWGCGALTVLNLFAYRSTDPFALSTVADPVGPENDEYLTKWATTSALFVAAWGVHGTRYRRAEKVCRLLERCRTPVMCLNITKGGHPVHPLYQRADSPLLDYPLPGKDSDGTTPPGRRPPDRGGDGGPPGPA